MEYDDYIRVVNFCKPKQNIELNHLANYLGVCKNELSENIKTLIQNGCSIIECKNELVSLLHKPDLYNTSLLLLPFSSQLMSPKVTITVLTLVDSTNTYLKSNLYKHDLISICIAEKQTNGRGRRGKEWHSPFGANITFSIRKKLNINAQTSGCISLVAGISLIKAFNRLGYFGLKIKWPNDIYFDHKKLAGILIEIVSIKKNKLDFIIGAGINIKMPKSNSAEIDQPWINLSEIGTDAMQSRNVIISTVINELIVNLDLFEKEGMKSFFAHWKKWDYLYGHAISVKQESIQIFGVAKGINENGELLVDSENNQLKINAGEVSVRLIDSHT